MLLEGDGFRMRPLGVDDCGVIVAASRSDIPDWTFVPRDLDETAARAWLQQRLGAKGTIRFVIEVEGVAVGVIGAHQPNAHDPGILEAFYCVLPEHRRRGLASAALRLLGEHAERELPELRRLQLQVIEGNPGSGRVAERAGYVLEGVMKSAIGPVNGFGPRAAALYARVTRGG